MVVFFLFLAGILAIGVVRSILAVDALAATVASLAGLASFGADPTEPLTALFVATAVFSAVAFLRGLL